MKVVATRGQILWLKCTKFDLGWGSTGGAYSGCICVHDDDNVTDQQRSEILQLLSGLRHTGMAVGQKEVAV